jgi:hypothetical protein
MDAILAMPAAFFVVTTGAPGTVDWSPGVGYRQGEPVDSVGNG